MLSLFDSPIVCTYFVLCALAASDLSSLCTTRMSKVYVVGGYITPFVGKGNPNFKKGEMGLKEYLSESIQVLFRSAMICLLMCAWQGCLEQTGVPAEAIDRSYVGNFVSEKFSFVLAHLQPSGW